VGFDVASEAKAAEEEEEEEEGARGNLGAGGDVEDHGDGGGRDTAHDLHDARTNPLLPKRRKVKSTRYAVPLVTHSPCNVDDLSVAGCGNSPICILRSARHG
jgi:hypothetical protein